MNAVLLLFLVSKFGLPDGTAGVIYSVFYFFEQIYRIDNNGITFYIDIRFYRDICSGSNIHGIII